MAVLSDVDLQKIIDGNEGIIILNKRDQNITGAGYDLTIGFIRDSETGKEPKDCIYDNNRYTLLPGKRYLVISKEFLHISSQFMATLHSRGSYALKGIIVTSTTVDPNYVGCITCSLFNCSSQEVYIKKDNSFATMVIHELRTPTKKYLPQNEHHRRMDAQETLHSRFPNIAREACDAGDIYYGRLRKEIEYEYKDALKEYEKFLDKKSQDKTEVTRNTPEKDESLDTILHEKNQRRRITFLIGNGFDLNVGLNTRYIDFYNYYKAKYKDDLLAQEIEDNIEDWADLESGLGKYTENVLPKNEDAFWHSEKNLEETLKEYLEGQMNRVNVREEHQRRNIMSKMEHSLTKFYEKFPENLKKQIKEIIEDTNNPVRYSFITFNYTDVLEQCLGTMLADSPVYLCAGDEKILYIHGTTIRENMVLGVDNESQIANKEFRNNSLNKQRLIKKEINMYYGNRNIEKACSIIDSSNIICIFGMSIGITDQMWWQYIAKWLQDNRTRKLIIFAKDTETYAIGKYTNECKVKMKEQFKKNLESSDIWDQIENQIYVEVNADIFNFKVVDDDKKTC